MKLRGFTAEVKPMPLEQSDTLASLTVSYRLKERRAMGEGGAIMDGYRQGRLPALAGKALCLESGALH